MDQRIGFCTSFDGTKIAYALTGHGPPLVRTATWITHIEHDLDHPIWRHWWQELSREHTLIRYDPRGCGLSDWNVEDFSLEARVEDLKAVIGHLELDRFDLLGMSHGAPAAVAFSSKHPERVQHLALYGGFTAGAYAGWSPDKVVDALWELIRVSWDEPKTRRMFATWIMPTAPIDVIDATVDLLHLNGTPENIVKLLSTASHFDISSVLPTLTIPTLVAHSAKGEMIPVSEGRRLATLLPNARYLEIESRNHILIESEPGWERYRSELRAFLATPAESLEGEHRPSAESGLSARELEVLGLIAKGMSDREIARALGISARTVGHHVSRILASTESTNRAQATAWAARRSLV